MDEKLQPRVLWLTGLSGAGKSTLAYALQDDLRQSGAACVVLDGDVMRRGLCRDLGFSAADRTENIRRVAEVAHLFAESGLVVLCALISPLRSDREMAAHIIGVERFREVHVATPLAVCEQRDAKGLYRRARAEQLTSFTGVSAPYEPPASPALRISTEELSLRASLLQLKALLA